MKKFFACLAVLCLSIALLGSHVQAKSKSGKTLIVYYSATGTTRTVAKKIQKGTKADIYFLQPKKKYTDTDLDYTIENGRIEKEQKNLKARPAIKGKIKNFKQYKNIILGYPIWWGDAPRMFSTFLESYNFKGKTVTAFCTSASSGINTSVKNLKKLTPKSTKWLKSQRFEEDDSQKTINRWLKSIGLR